MQDEAIADHRIILICAESYTICGYPTIHILVSCK
jgi:hypothetical protein